MLKHYIKPIMKALVCLLLALTITITGFFLYIKNSCKGRIVLKYTPPTILLQDRYGNYLDDMNYNNEHYGFWRIKGRIPEKIIESILIAEDRRFYSHKGIDYKALLRAAYINLMYRKVISGASTLAMQIARMQNPGKRTFINKFREMYIARQLVARYGHRRILNHYLTIAPFGPNIHSLAFASQKYFNKPVQDINWGEAVLLASLPKNPVKFNLYSVEGKLKAFRRVESLLRKLHSHDRIDANEYETALNQLNRIEILNRDKRPEESIHAILRLKALLKDGNGIERTGSPLIRSSLDLNLQKKVQYLADQYMRRIWHLGAGNVSIIIADRKAGDVLAYIGSADYFDEDKHGQINYANILRSAGSTLKPFIYALGMDLKGYTGATILRDSKLVFPSKYFIYQPQNADKKFLKEIIYRKALANSRNLPAISLVEDLGLEHVYNYFRYLGLQAGNKSAEYYGLGIAVGGVYVTLEDLVRVYGVLANDGQGFSLNWTRQKRQGGKVQLIKPDLARMISLFLSDPSSRYPTFKRMGSLEYSFPVALKTGTSQGYRDAWVAGYTTKYVIGVWTGTHDFTPMNHLTGANSSAILMQYLIALLHPEEVKGMKDVQFKPPENYVARQVCQLTGMPATGDSPFVYTEWFKPETDEPFRTKKETVGVRKQEKKPGRITALALESTEKPIKINLIEPIDLSKIYIDQSIPEKFQTLSLRARIEGEVEQVVWYVDGKPYEVKEKPYTARWQLCKGEHTFQVRVPYSGHTSRTVKIKVH